MTFHHARWFPLSLAPVLALGCVIELDGDLRHLGRSCASHLSPTNRHVEVDEPFTSVVVQGEVGDIRVHDHAGAGAIVDAEVRGDEGGPELRVRVDEGVLHVAVECGRGGCCDADLDLAVPAETTLELEHGVGDIDVVGIAGAVTVDVGTGDITLDAIGGSLDLDVGTGSIEGRGLGGGDAWVDVGVGDVALQWSDEAPLGAAAVDVGVGSVALTVPAGSYDLRLDTGVGQISVDGVHDDRGAVSQIIVDVGTGDIDVHGG